MMSLSRKKIIRPETVSRLKRFGILGTALASLFAVKASEAKTQPFKPFPEGVHQKFKEDGYHGTKAVKAYRIHYIKDKKGDKGGSSDTTGFDVRAYHNVNILHMDLLKIPGTSIKGLDNHRNIDGKPVQVKYNIFDSLDVMKIYYTPLRGTIYNFPAEVTFEGGKIISIYCNSTRKEALGLLMALRGLGILRVPLINLGFSAEEIEEILLEPVKKMKEKKMDEKIREIKETKDYTKKELENEEAKPVFTKEEIRKIKELVDEEYNERYTQFQKKYKEETSKYKKTTAEKLEAEKRTRWDSTALASLPRAILFEKPPVQRTGNLSKPIEFSPGKKFKEVFNKGLVSKMILEHAAERPAVSDKSKNYGEFVNTNSLFKINFEVHGKENYTVYFYLKGNKKSPIIDQPVKITHNKMGIWFSFSGSGNDFSLILEGLQKEILRKNSKYISRNLAVDASALWKLLGEYNWNLNEARRQLEYQKSLKQ